MYKSRARLSILKNHLNFQIKKVFYQNSSFLKLQLPENRRFFLKLFLTLKDSLRESQDPLLEAEAENAEETAADRCGCRTGFVLNFANRSSIDGAFVVLSEELSFS